MVVLFYMAFHFQKVIELVKVARRVPNDLSWHLRGRGSVSLLLVVLGHGLVDELVDLFDVEAVAGEGAEQFVELLLDLGHEHAQADGGLDPLIPVSQVVPLLLG